MILRRQLPRFGFAPVLVLALAPWSCTHLSAAPGTDAVTTRPGICYREAGGAKLVMDVFLPPADLQSTAPKGRAAVLLIHGGGWAGGDRSTCYDAARWFAARGFVCFAAQYRLVKPTADKWPAQLDDVQAAVRWIREHAAEYNVNPAAIGAAGNSAGSHLVSLLGLCDTRDTATAQFPKQSSRVTCVVDLFGPSDLTARFPTTGPYGISVQKLVDDFLGKPAVEAPEIARDASPINHITPAAVPFLIIHGDQDSVVPPDQSARFHEALKKAGVDSTLIWMKGENHGLRPENLELYLRESLAFFRKHLQ